MNSGPELIRSEAFMTLRFSPLRSISLPIKLNY